MDKKIILDKLFPIYDKEILLKLQIDHESISYITIPNDTKKINAIIAKHIVQLNKNIKECNIIDATGGVGGDTIAFSKYFGSVISIELNPQRYEFLKNNVSAYGYKNVSTINGNSIDIIPKITDIDVIYIDPPWGGKSYKEATNLRLSLGDKSIESLIKIFFDPVHMLSTPTFIVLKLPKNYDLKYLFEYLNAPKNEYNIFMYELKKIIIIVIEKINRLC